MQSDRLLRVVTLTTELEDFFEAEAGSFSASTVGKMAVRPEQFEKIAANLTSLLGPVVKRGIMPVCFLCRGDIRPALEEYISEFIPFPGVFSFHELDPRMKVQQIGVWSL
jgi:flagellar biosynthesis component FlhA